MIKTAKSAKPAKATKAAARPDAAVIELLRRLDHPMRPQIDAVRTLILGASPTIQEIVKWNAPSFRTGPHDFVTFNLRAKDRIRLVFHTGAKVKAGATKPDIADPAALLEWLANDRALVTLASDDDIATKGAALQALVRAWLEALPAG